MLTFAGLLEEVRANGAAREAMGLIGSALASRSSEEQSAFWRAIDLYYVSRKAPGAETARDDAIPPEGGAIADG